LLAGDAGAVAAAGGLVVELAGCGVSPEWNFTTSGTMSRATMLMILISGLTAGPAVSL
jgi:hypothetical protein